METRSKKKTKHSLCTVMHRNFPVPKEIDDKNENGQGKNRQQTMYELAEEGVGVKEASRRPAWRDCAMETTCQLRASYSPRTILYPSFTDRPQRTEHKTASELTVENVSIAIRAS